MDLYDGKYTKGGQQIEVDAPYDRMPIYVKAGAIIPYGPEIQFTTEKPADKITLYVYEGQDGEFDLYEDENTNYNYEQGKYALIPLRYNDQSGELNIGEQQGETFEGRLEERTFNIIYVRKNQPRALDFDLKADQSVEYSGKEKTVRLK